MGEAGVSGAVKLILREIEAVLARVGDQEVRALEEAVMGAGAVFVTGEGRSGLVGRCFAMRLMHLGLQARVAGETTTPAIRPGDLLIAISGSGETPITCLLASSAAAQGARVAALTAAARSPLAAAASLILLVPAAGGQGSGGGSEQHGGSLFEQSALVLLDALALRLQRRLGQTRDQMQARHANLE